MNTMRIMRMSIVFLALVMTARAEWLDGWQHRRSFAVDASQVEAELTNFPVLVRLTTGQLDFGLAAANGHDLRFTDSDGTTVLDFERESHDAVTGTAAYWVRLPLVSAASDTTFYLYYGNGGASDGAVPAGVWDSAHVGVWHLNGTDGITQADSTAGANHLAVYPAALDAGDVLISDCDNLTGWTGTDLSLDGTNKDPNVDSVNAIKESIASVVIGQTNTIIYNPAAPLALGQRQLDYMIQCTTSNTAFSTRRVYVYDTAGNYRYHEMGAFYPTHWRYMGFGINEGGVTGGTAPDVDAIDRIEWMFVAADDKPYDLQIDTLYANGALDEGSVGVVGDGVRFSGSDQYLVTTQAQSIDTAEGLTYSMWVRPKNYYISQRDGYASYIVACGGGNWAPFWLSALSYRNEGEIYGYTANGNNEGIDRSLITKSMAGFSTVVWSHLAASYYYDPVTSNTTMKFFMNGVHVNDWDVTGRAIRAVMDRPIVLGAIKWAKEGDEDFMRGFFNGDLDEVRVSNVRRSTAWINASFLSQQADSSFVRMGASESTASWLGGWKYRRAITIDSSDIDADLTNFPVLVRLSSDSFDFSLAATDGRDLRFTDTSGGAVLSFERESHDASVKMAAYWVRLPQVSATSNTTFYIYYGNSGAQSMATTAAVWDSAHVGVWHLGNTNGVTQPDSTATANHVIVTPAALDAGYVNISDCDTLTGWTGTDLSLDGINKDPNVGSLNAIKETVASVVIGQTNTIVYSPASPLVLGERRLDFYIRCNKEISSKVGFTLARVYLYDTAGNYRYHNMGYWAGSQWRYMGFGIGAEGTTGGTAPDVNDIDRIEWVFVSKDVVAYDVQIDTVVANGALEEGVPGTIGDGVRMSGNDQYLVTSKVPIIDTADGLTYSAWVRPHHDEVPNTVDSRRAYIVSIGGANWSRYWCSFLTYYNKERIFLFSSEGNEVINPPIRTPYLNVAGFHTNVWSHVAATYHFDPVENKTSVACYIDGVEKINHVMSGSALRPVMDKPIYLGAVQWAPSMPDKFRGFFNGDMDEVRVSNVRRSDAWIKASYINQAPGSALLAFGKMEPPRGAVILIR